MMRTRQYTFFGRKALGQIQALYQRPLAFGYRRLEGAGNYLPKRAGRVSIFIATFVLFLLTLSLSVAFFDDPDLYIPDGQDVRAPSAYMHLLIPASHVDVNLCKTVLSAAILGYPSPTLLNWEKEFNDANLVEGGSHVAKISGIKQYLDSLGPERDEDLVLMVDGYDIWFQLRPKTLVDRFFDINRRANERIRKDLGSDLAEQNGIEQNILFSCQKRCWPWTEEDPPCYAVPQSSLPADIYGKDTDTDIGDEKNPYIKYRQRFLNSGVAIGTAGAMRKLFTEALVRAEEDSNFGSDQHIFSRLLGEQELHREVQRLENLTWWQKLKIKCYGDKRREIFKEEHLEAVRNGGKNLEFNLGLDYESSIGLATVFAEDDTEWVTMSDSTQLLEAKASHGVEYSNNRLQGLSQDIEDTLPPFWTFASQPDLPRNTSWSDVSLFTDVWTGITPAIIHHNAHRDGMKSLREGWWDRIWFQKHARTLYDMAIIEPLGPIAVAGDGSGKTYWSSEDWKGGARDSEGKWWRYEEMCTGGEAEVFRDGEGPWTLPDDH